MSKEQRIEAQALRAKYARVFGLPLSEVCINCLDEGGDAIVHDHQSRFPEWSLGKAEQFTRKAGEP